MAKNNNSGGMTPGSRKISMGAMKAGVKQMNIAKGQAAWKSDAATLIKPSSQKNTIASLTKQMRMYQGYLQSGKMPKGLTRTRVNNALDSMAEQIAMLKKKGGK